jgi:hypothetical protein
LNLRGNSLLRRKIRRIEPCIVQFFGTWSLPGSRTKMVIPTPFRWLPKRSRCCG